MVKEQEIIALTIRMPLDFRGQLKRMYWKTADRHKLSDNAWLLNILEREVQRLEKKHNG